MTAADADPLHEQLVAAHAVGTALRDINVTYLIGGSVASSMQGVMRATVDVDLVADLSREHAQPLVDALIDDCYIDLDAVLEAIRRRASFNVIHLPTAYKIDVFAMRRDAFSRMELSRREFKQVVGSPDPLPIASAEDIVLRKLFWFRHGGEASDRQWTDVQGVLKVNQGRLDLDYMRRWSQDLLVTDLLERAFDAAW